jgi:hypothetical protein
MLIVRLLLLLTAASACAQDPFEIHVYEYEPLKRGAFTYEAHLNYVLKGTTAFTGPVAPMQDQLHFTSEITAGLSEQFAVGVMLLTARRPDHSLEYAGWRVLPHFYAPRSWNLPFDLGLVTEFSFQRTTFEENSRRVEVRPIIEKHIGRLELTGNPVFERALHGPGTSDGWAFEPAGRVGWQAYKKFTPSVEYYSSWGPVANFPAFNQQVHQIVPGGDLKIGERLTWSFGAGCGLSDTGSRLVIKSRFEWAFGRKVDP